MNESGKQRLFFALWPDAAQRRDLQRCFSLLADFPGRVVVANNLHLTLAFPGNVDVATRGCLEQAASKIQLPPFSFTLDQFGYWKHPKVIWYGPTEVPETLVHLAEALAAAMRHCGLEPDPRPYRPHVTLLRKAQAMPQTEAPRTEWRAEGFALVLSESAPGGVRYSVLHQWPLRS